MSDFQTDCPSDLGVIRIAVRENSRMATQLLCSALARESNFDVFGVGDIEEITTPAPQILLLSTGTPSRLACEVLERLRKKHPETKAILLVEEPTRELVVEAFRSGARGVFSRNEPLESLSKCVSSVNKGQVWANQVEIGYLLGAISEPVPMPLVDANGITLLSKREQSVVRYVAEGMTNREIANQLQLSEHTVKNYMFRIFDKLGVSSRVELIIYALSKLTPSLVAPASAKENKVAQDEQVSLNTCSDMSSLSQHFKPYFMAEIYREGRGVPRDEVTALMWFKVSEALAGELQGKSKISQRELKAAMSPEQIAEACQRTAEFLSLKMKVSPTPINRVVPRQGLPPIGIRQHVQKVRFADREG